MDITINGARVSTGSVTLWQTPLQASGVDSVAIKLGPYEELEIKYLPDTAEVCVLHKGLVDGEPEAECVFSVTREES